MDQVRETMNLGNMCGGRILGKVDHEIEKVLKNIVDPNTPAEQKRKIVLTLTFIPADNRELGTIMFSCESKLAAATIEKGNFFIARRADNTVRGYARDPKQSELFQEEKSASGTPQ